MGPLYCGWISICLLLEVVQLGLELSLKWNAGTPITCLTFSTLVLSLQALARGILDLGLPSASSQASQALFLHLMG